MCVISEVIQFMGKSRSDVSMQLKISRYAEDIAFEIETFQIDTSVLLLPVFLFLKSNSIIYKIASSILHSACQCFISFIANIRTSKIYTTEVLN